MDLWLYVYGNGDFIYTILTSVNFFMRHSITFFEVSAILSLLIFAVEVTGIMPNRGYNWMKFVKVYFLISVFVLTPYPGKVNVHDVITNDNYIFNPTHGKLPIGLIVPISIISDIMYRLINLYQQNYAIDSNLNYTYSGMNFGANFILSLDNVNSYDDKFNYNLDNYMQNCGFPLLHKAGKLADLRKSNDIFATLKQNTSNGRYVQQVNFISGQPIIKPCDIAINDIDNYYNAQDSNILKANANIMGVNTNIGWTRFLNAADAASSQLLGISQNASSVLKQAIGMNMIMTALKNGAQTVGNGSLALAAYDAEQFQQYKKSGELAGAASARTIPVLVASAFALLFFLYPIMIFLAIALGSYKALGVFFQIAIAINLIPLLYEILNYISTYYLQKKLGILIVGSGYNYDVSTSLYSFTDNMIVAGNYLATSAPLIAYAIVSGSSMALTSVFGHINDPAKSQAMQVGNESARGNINLGNASIDNASFNNMQGNKLDDQLIASSGVPIMKNTSSGGIHTNVGGSDYNQNFKSDLLSTPNFAHIASSTLQNSLTHNKQELEQLSKQWGQQSQRLHELSNGLQSQQGSSSSIGSEDAHSLAQAQLLANTMSATLKTPGIFAAGANSSIDSQISDRYQNDAKEYQKYANELSHSSNQAIRDAFSNTHSLLVSSSNTVSETLSNSQALNDIQSNQSAIQTNYSNEFNSYMNNKGINPLNIGASEQNTLAESFVKEKINNEYGIRNELNIPSNELNHLNHRVRTENINSDGLENPNNDNNLIGNKLHEENMKKFDDFQENPGNIAGEQIKKQLITGVGVVKNVAQKATSIASDALYEVVHLNEIGKNNNKN
jgi:conjugal transfer mating pair stabilization protein TraG